MRSPRSLSQHYLDFVTLHSIAHTIGLRLFYRTGIFSRSRIGSWAKIDEYSCALSEFTRPVRERDPLVLNKTRIGTIYGLADLMNQAFEQAKQVDRMTLRTSPKI